MYLNQKEIKRLMAVLDWTHIDVADYAYVSASTVWNILTKHKYNTSAETGLRLYRVFKVEGVITHPSQIIDIELMDREAIKLAR